MVRFIIIPFMLISLSVTNVSGGMVTFKSKSGDLYKIEEAEAWRVGDPAIAFVHTNFTDTPEDDIILGIRYKGWKH